jgi:hypothetical protein
MLRGLNRRLEEKGVAPPRWFITVNEPNMLASSTYNLGAFPAGRRAWWAAALCALQTMLESHVVVRRQVRALYAEHPDWGQPMLSFNTFASDLYWMDKMLFDVMEAARQTRGKESILAYLNERAREFTRAYRSMDFPRHSLFSEAAGELIKQIRIRSAIAFSGKRLLHGWCSASARDRRRGIWISSPLIITTRLSGMRCDCRRSENSVWGD